ncbi:MAG: hypothetical protein IJ123_01290 [Blautia sp.]|nr:hypothetical protein [Blautia sp.]
MKNILRRLLLLLAVFILGIAGTAMLLNNETTDDRSDMNDPVLPELMVQTDDVLANRMFGYVMKMQTDFMRDSVTPLDTTRTLTFVINPYQTTVKSLSYEIRTSDGSKVMENRKIKNLSASDQYLKAEVTVESDLRMNQEYSMQVTLDTDKGNAYYYTRIVYRSGLHTADYVHFVKSFYEKCMDKQTADDLSVYLEAGNTGNTTNFTNISINSSLSEISWGTMKPQVIKKGIPVIREINETTASISIAYQISAKDDDGVTELYNVDEFYRMRYSDTRIMLLDFYRSAEQVFIPGDGTISEQGLNLGIRSRDVNYMPNDEISVIAFEQEGELWTWAPDDGKLVRIFSFRRDEGSDFRDARQEHDIKIIRVGETGDVDFVLSGYMNRGAHEGKCGICVYHYNSDQNVLEEKVFIPGTESHAFLAQDLGTLSYVNRDNELFLLFARKLYCVDIESGKYNVIDGNIKPQYFAVSDESAHAAWIVQEGQHEGQIRMIEFDTGESRYLESAEGQSLRTIGFMNEDLIYGIVYDEDIIDDINGHEQEGISTFIIESFEGEQKKVYHQDGFYVTDAGINGTLMEFNLAEKTEKGFVVKKKDNIMNNRKANASTIDIEMTSTSRTGLRVRISPGSRPGTYEPLIVNARLRSASDHEALLDSIIPEDDVYYVYARGTLALVTENVAEAVKTADTLMGVVLNRSQQYVWERGNRKSQIMLNIDDIPYAFRTGTWDADELQESLDGSVRVIDLSGCTLDSVLYEVGAQRAVIVKTGADTCQLIVGYDEYNTWLYDPETRETVPFGMHDSTELFEKAGNIFLSYIPDYR